MVQGYYPDIWPPVGLDGVVQCNYKSGMCPQSVILRLGIENSVDKKAYFSKVEDARHLQRRFVQEAKIDIIDRVAQALSDITNVHVRIARDEDHEYFAGVLRVVNESGGIHADYGPFVCPALDSLCTSPDS